MLAEREPQALGARGSSLRQAGQELESSLSGAARAAKLCAGVEAARESGRYGAARAAPGPTRSPGTAFRREAECVPKPMRRAGKEAESVPK